MKNNREWIDKKLYNKITQLMPTVCVDLVIIWNKKFLLGKRINEPARGKWFMPGGRVYKNEFLIDAAKRKLREEVGIKATKDKFKEIYTGETIFKGKGLDKNRHTVNIVYKITLEKEPKLYFDKSQHSEFRWFGNIDSKWHLYLKKALVVAGF